MLIQLTAASTEPVTLSEAKAHLRMTHAADDTLITRQIKAAREFVERTTGVGLAPATWRMTEDGFGDYFELPLSPVSAVDALSYVDSDGVRVVLAPAAYVFDADRLTVSPLVDTTWPSGSLVNLDFTTAPALISEGLKTAILLRVQAEYEADPDEAMKLRNAAHHLAYPWRANLGV